VYKFIINHIPIDGDNRPGIKAIKDTFTVHNTANTATDTQERNNLARPDNREEVGFNFVCDGDSVTEAIPDNEVTYHAGNAIGNRSSVSLEVAELPGAEQVAIEFIADYLKKRGWGVDRLRPHKYWSGKNCPRIILPHWAEFVQAIKNRMEGGSNLDGVIVYRFGDMGTALLLSSKIKMPMIAFDDIKENPEKVSNYKELHLIGKNYTMQHPNIIIHGAEGKDRYDSCKQSI
jgi:N-acetylmuramoyl-L-alanine amidase